TPTDWISKASPSVRPGPASTSLARVLRINRSRTPGVADADPATPKWGPGARHEPRTVVCQAGSCRRYPIWGWPGLLLKGNDGSPYLVEGIRRLGLRKRSLESKKNLTQFGHPFKYLSRASLRSDNCPIIPDQCPAISDWVSEFIGIRIFDLHRPLLVLPVIPARLFAGVHQ